LFDPDSDHGVDSASGTARSHDGIPRLKPDKEDIGVNVILAAGAVADPEKRVLMFARALKAHPDSVELKLRMVDDLVTLGRIEEAEKRLAEVQSAHPTDWRLAWYRGRALLAQGKLQDTLTAFETIVSELPGELAPKQALGRAYEESGELDRAIGYYDAVSKADATFTSAALGLARCLEKRNDKAGAVAAYRRVPSTSSRFAQAQMALARLLIHTSGATADDVLQAAAAVEGLDGIVDGLETHKLRAEIFRAAVAIAPTGKATVPDPVLGEPFERTKMRLAAEKEFRTCSRMVDKEEDRFRYVDEANAIRPMTFT